jgi:hypothetical protein
MVILALGFGIMVWFKADEERTNRSVWNTAILRGRSPQKAADEAKELRKRLADAGMSHADREATIRMLYTRH